MPIPTSLDLTLLLHVTGRKSATAKREDTTLPLVLLLALDRDKGGRGGAPAELGLPLPLPAARAPIEARPAATYAF